MTTAQVGVVGLAVMGGNLSRNLARQGLTVAVYDRVQGLGRDLASGHEGVGGIVDCANPESLIAALARPRAVILLVPAGRATDAVIRDLAPLMEAGDTIIDAGNARFEDTENREKALAAMGIRFIGAGVSGGEEGALHGPSIMAGGGQGAWDAVRPMLEGISARVDGEPCCALVGPGGAGHFVKTVHNGIEYAVLQLIAEAYHLLREGLGETAPRIGEAFADWNASGLDSYLLEVSAEALRHEDARTGRPLVDVILDEAGNKGTGVWAAQAALGLGVPATGVAEAAFARALSARREQRESIRAALGSPEPDSPGEGFQEDVRQALEFATRVAYAQGFDLIHAGSDEHGWGLDCASIARVWRGGCIIRARLLDAIVEANIHDPGTPSLLTDPPYMAPVIAGEAAWRRVVSWAVLSGIPVPVFSSLLSYVDALRTERLPAALIQAQRDFFGAHTYRRIDVDGAFHTLWSSDRSEKEV
ncbi:MAG: NADP-dependent phosphogluconate dehydrogenase [Demequinaceae bacterium]|nr:NADP-dependent phosphogluconate dehydrogenase [Demequinaceae bacterium]